MIVRYYIMQGRKVSYVPGWDCHGLPIELKAIKTDAQNSLSPVQIRKIAQRFSQTTMEAQMNEFKSWGITGDWENRYCTMGSCRLHCSVKLIADRAYEIRQLEIFLEMVKKGMMKATRRH